MPTILVIEDEPSIAELFQEILEEEGFQVVLAYNGQKGLDVALRTKPDLIFCDLMMPIMTGWDFLQRIRELSDFQAVPIVMMSAGHYVPPEFAHLYNGFLAKPLNFNRLMDLVHQLLST